MHIKSILSHQWLSMTRSTIWERQLATKILAGFALSYLLFCFLFIGFNLGKIIQLVSPNSDSVYIVSQIIIYFIAFDLMMRVFMQSIPRLQVAPYLHLNLSKQKLANIFLFKSVANIFNLYPLVIILPFALIEIPVNYSLSASIGFIVGLILIILMNNFLALFIKLIAQKYFVFHFLPVIIVLGIFAFVSSKVLDIGLFSALLGLSFLKFSLAFPAFAALILCFFLISKKFLTGEMYIDQLSRSKTNSGKTEVSEIGFVNTIGDIGKYISLEMKMIGRNKRPKTLALMSIIIVVYFGFLMVTTMKYQPMFVAVMFAVFMSCPFMLMHGQFMFNWESTYFDLLMSKNVDFKKYLKAKYYLFVAASLVTITFTAIFMFITNKDIFQFISVGLFTLGFYAFVMFYLSIYNKSRIDLNKSAYFNYQGSGISQFLLVIIGLAIPFLFKFIFDDLIGQSITNYLLCGIGLVFIVMHNKWIGIVADAFLKRKYINLEGYRK